MSYSRHRGISKPLPGCFVDWAHPLSLSLAGYWLLNEGGGTLLNDAAKQSDMVLENAAGSNPTWIGSPNGGALSLLETNKGYAKSTSSTIRSISPPFSVVTRLLRGSSVSDVVNILSHDSGINDGWRISAFGPGFGDALYLTFGGVGDYNLTTGIPRDSWVNLAICCNLSVVTGYVDSTVSSVAVGSMVGAPNRLTLGSGFFNQYWDGGIAYASVYRRELSRSEVSSLFDDPFSYILSPSYRRYFIPAAGGGLSIPVAMHYRRMMGRN